MLSKFSVKKPYTIIVAIVTIILLGFVAFTKMNTDLLPDINLPYMVVMTSYPGASPEEIEMTVTKPVEQAMARVGQIKEIQSTSSANVSLVVLEFSGSANMDAVTIDVRENLDMISGYWSDDVGTPTVMKLNPDMMPVMVSAMDGEGMSVSDITKIAQDKYIPMIESVEGVANVSVSGAVEKQVNVVINQDKINDVNQEIEDALSGKFDDGLDKMEKAEKKLQDGKETLSEQREKAVKGMTEGELKLTSARLEILKGEIQMADGEAELATQEAELKKALKKLPELKKQLKSAKAQKKTLETTKQTLTESITKGTQALDQLDAGIQQMGGEKSPMAATLVQQKTGLSKQMETAKTGLAQVDSGLTSVNTGITELEKAIQQMEDGQKALTNAKKKMEKAKKKLTKGITKIEDGQTELAKQKDSATTKMTVAESELNSGEATLKEKKKELEQQKKDAIKAAKVSDKITMDMVKGVLTAQDFSMPAGYITDDSKEYLVRVGDKLEKEDELSDMVLFDLGIDDLEPIKLSDVADVFTSDNSAEIYAKMNGNEGIVLAIEKQNNYATSEVSKSIQQRFDQISKQDKRIHFTNLMDQGMYIKLVIDSVLNNLVIGGILAILILLLFLRDLKPTFITACSIPVSVVFAVALMYFSGVTLNIISLSGLAVGIGMLVDNSIVVIENIYRLRSKGYSIIRASVNGAKQVAGAITSSTLTTVCVFLPIIFVEGLVRQIFTDMALTILYSLLASLIIALTFVPMMASMMMKKQAKEKKHRLQNFVFKVYEKVLPAFLRFRWVVIIVSVAIMALSVYLELGMGTSFMPDMDSTQISVTATMPEASQFTDTVEVADRMMEKVQKVKDVETVGITLGGSGMMGMSMGGSEDSISAYVILKMDKKRTSKEVAADIEEACQDIGAEEVIANGSAIDMSALGGSGVQVIVKGTDLKKLQEVATDVAGVIEKVKGTTEVNDGQDKPEAEIAVHVNREKAIEKGFTVAQVFTEVKNALTLETTGSNMTLEDTEYSMIFKKDDSASLTREQLEDYVIKTTGQDGKTKKVKLGKIATFTEGVGLSSIKRKAQTRYISVTAMADDNSNIGIVGQDVQDALKDYKTPEGISIEFAGEDEEIMDAMIDLVYMLLLAIALIYMIMVAQFQSLLSPFIVLFTIPLAFTGGFLGLYITGNELSVIALVGFVILSGVVVNNGIVYVDYVNQLRRDGMEKRAALVEAGKTRMRPILMTALTTISAMLIMALGKEMGTDMMRPIAIVSIFGLAYATVMTLFVVPAIYDIMNRKKYRQFDESEFAEINEEE